MNRAARALAVLGFVLSGSCLIRQLHADTSPAPPTVDCDPALEVDGHLHCGGEGRLALARVCGPESARLVSGDAVQTGDGCRPPGRMAGPDLAALQVPVDVNTAELPELESLPGIGPVLARRIAAGRPFGGVDDLDRVEGIGVVRMAALRRRARVTGPVPIPAATPVSLVSP